MYSFVVPFRFHGPLNICPPSRTSRRPRIVRWASSGSQTIKLSLSSTALDYDNTTNPQISRYIDLRSMKVVLPEQAHISPIPESFSGFKALSQYSHLFDDPTYFQRLREIIFTADTLPLSEAQKDAVFALLSRHSVVFPNATSEDKHTVVLDMAMRCRLWKETVIYCTSSRRSAETMFAFLCAQLGPERRHEVLFHFGDGVSRCIDGPTSSQEPIRVVITSESVLRSELISTSPSSWIESSTLLFMDGINETSLVEFEDVLLSLPSRFLVCLLSSHLARPELEILPLWVESIQSSTSLISTTYTSSLLNRIDRPENTPLLRAFIYNAAIHEHPVQLSLNILKGLVQQEIEHPNVSSAPDYSQAFLRGVTQIGAEDPAKLFFHNGEEAAYADFAALIVADAKLVENEMRPKLRKRSRSKRKERTASSRAAARRRREIAYSESMIFPAIIVIKGHSESLLAAQAIRSALDTVNLLWDEDTQSDVISCVDLFSDEHGAQFTPLDMEVLELLRIGIGVTNDRYTPAIRTLVEELFRSGMLPVIIADSHLGSEELCVLPSSKSVLVDFSTLAMCDDTSKGLVLSSTLAGLSGRTGKDDVGNMFVLWYDNEIDDEMVGREIASTLLAPDLISSSMQTATSSSIRPIEPIDKGMDSKHSFDARFGSEVHQHSQSKLLSSYGAVLRSLRRFGLDGCKFIHEYTFESFKGWLKRAALHATLEKFGVDKRAIDERLQKEDWESIADYQRKAAKVNETRRLHNAMILKLDAVVERYILQELKGCRPGHLLKVRKYVSYGNENLKISGSTVANADQRFADSKDEDLAAPGHNGGLQLFAENPRTLSASAAVFVTILDQERDGKRMCDMESRFLVVCIMTDGTWTMIPARDVDAIMADAEELIANVDLLMVPHPATFDLDPDSKWAKCVPVDDSERIAVQRVSDELVARITSDVKPKFVQTTVPEFESHKDALKRNEEAYHKSKWHGKDELVTELQKLRRRAIELQDEIMLLEKRRNRLEDDTFEHHNDCRSLQTALMAVLEDCHALSYISEVNAEMTPIGALASVLPCEYPVFVSACLCLTDSLEELSKEELLGFLATIACSETMWVSEDSDEEHVEDFDSEPLDLSSVSKRDQMTTELSFGEEELSEAGVIDTTALRKFLPPPIVDIVFEVRNALHQLHKRHLTECQAVERLRVNDIVPHSLNTQMAEATMLFANGASWSKVCEKLGNRSGYGVEELRRVRSIVEFIWKDEKYGEFSDSVKNLARQAYEAMGRWPLDDNHTMVELVENGIVERTWAGGTYERWWRLMRDALNAMSSVSSTSDNSHNTNEIESVL